MRFFVPPHKQRAFTLVEIVIALAIVAIMASIAYPAYTSQVTRARVGAAVADIAHLQMDLERYFTDHYAYPASLSELGPIPLDPWGNPYQYLRMSDATTGQMRKDRSLHPLNSDYDLCSMGPDGRSASPLTAHASQDDIIRAGNGSFIGLAANY
jgi:general secretion pathway protein G